QVIGFVCERPCFARHRPIGHGREASLQRRRCERRLHASSCEADIGANGAMNSPGKSLMLLLVLTYLGGVLTILSPCILPVLPFVFARADRRFARNGLPMLAGMALTFAVVATLAAVGGGWAVRANQYGRIAALAVLAALGLTLLSN